MAARKPRQATTVTDEEGGKTKKTPPVGKSKKPAPAKQPAPTKQPKQVKKKPSKPNPSRKIRKGKSLESFQAPVGGVAIREPVSGITRQLPVVEGKRKGIATDEQATQSLLDLQKSKKQNVETGADTEKSNSEGDTEILNVAEEQGEDVSNTVALEERTVELDEGQARSGPGKTHES
ncbi:hypothetical protein Tco_1490346 [Tanacetum coccineum]